MVAPEMVFAGRAESVASWDPPPLRSGFTSEGKRGFGDVREEHVALGPAFLTVGVHTEGTQGLGEAREDHGARR